VRWWYEGKDYKIYKYEGQYLYDQRLANKLLACMQSDVEKKVFRIEKYLYQAVDVAPYLRTWLKEQKHLSPATYKDYQNSIDNHLVPWFEKNRLMLHEIQYDVLGRLVNDIKREGKGKQNVMYCLHKCLDSAWKSGRIQSIPPFPEKNKYGIVEPEITWVNEERQMAINELPRRKQRGIHRPPRRGQVVLTYVTPYSSLLYTALSHILILYSHLQICLRCSQNIRLSRILRPKVVPRLPDDA
jgi:hypothetical protein